MMVMMTNWIKSRDYRYQRKERAEFRGMFSYLMLMTKKRADLMKRTRGDREELIIICEVEDRIEQNIHVEGQSRAQVVYLQE